MYTYIDIYTLVSRMPTAGRQHLERGLLLDGGRGAGTIIMIIVSSSSSSSSSSSNINICIYIYIYGSLLNKHIV